MPADWNIATGKEQPINRTGLDNVQETGDIQGMLAGVDVSGSTPQLVQADAAPDANEAGSGPVTAVGVFLPREVIPDDVRNFVGEGPFDDLEAQMYEENWTQSGDRVTVISYGIELVNDGSDADFTPGEPVYLAEGGGVTQTPPTTADAAVQCVGVALTPEDMGPAEGRGPDGRGGRERMLLDVDYHYETA